MVITFEFSGLGLMVERNLTTNSATGTAAMDQLSLLLPYSRYGGVTHRPVLMAKAEDLEVGTPLDRVISLYDPVAVQHVQYVIWDLNDCVVNPSWGTINTPRQVRVPWLQAEPTTHPNPPNDPAGWIHINWIADLDLANGTKINVLKDCLDRKPSNAQLASRIAFSHGEMIVLPPSADYRDYPWDFTNQYSKRAFSDAFQIKVDADGPFSLSLDPFRSGPRSRLLEFKTQDLTLRIANMDDQKRGTTAAAEHFEGHYDLTDATTRDMPKGTAAVDPVFCFAARVSM